MPARTSYPKHKREYTQRLNDLLDVYDTFFVVVADNVLSGQMHDVRAALRGRAVIVMGKNTLMRMVIRKRLEENDNERNRSLYEAFAAPGSNILTGNVGLVLTNAPVAEILDVLGQYKVLTAARAGAIAPIEVMVPAGRTGLEPTLTPFFMDLNIAVKIEQSQISITKDVIVCRVNEKVGISEAKLLQRLKIKPFLYGLETQYVYEKGTLFPRSCVGISDATLGEWAQGAVDDIAGLSLETGIQSAPALPHQVIGAFKDVLGLAFATGITFPNFGADTFIDGVLSGKLAAAAPAAAAPGAAAAAPAAAAPAPAPVEEEEAGDFGMDLF